MLSAQMDRRDFLKVALAGGLAVGTAPLLAACAPGAKVE